MTTIADMPEMALVRVPSHEAIDEIEALAKQAPQIDCPLVHHFAPGVYAREIHMPAGTFIIGKIHKTRHLCIVSQGRALVGGVGEAGRLVEAPCTFMSEIGTRRWLRILDDMVWTTIHPTNETDLEKIEALIIEPHPVAPRIEQADGYTELEVAL